MDVVLTQVKCRANDYAGEYRADEVFEIDHIVQLPLYAASDDVKEYYALRANAGDDPLPPETA